jgi:peptide/nickel transport system substrate-binding protein
MKTQTADLSVATPWFRLQQLLYSNSLPEPGKPLYFNQGRYENKKVNELLDIIPTLKDSTALRKTYKELNRIVMQDIPVIPVFYKPTQYYQFSTKNWTNFPTEENPYAPPENLITAAGVKALWSIRQTKKQN